MKILTELINLIYPNLCLCCAKDLVHQEECICLHCLQDIPRTQAHISTNNKVEERFWGKAEIEQATSFFYFSRGSVFQKILHHLKYKGNQTIGEVLGSYAASELLPYNYFSTIDLIIPVPLHPKKEQARGYNQSLCIAKGVAKILHKPIDTKHLYRAHENLTQTKKNVFERHINTKGIFKVHSPDELIGKHILLIDDVLTTGATIEACIFPLKTISNVKVSVFTLAMA